MGNDRVEARIQLDEVAGDGGVVPTEAHGHRTYVKGCPECTEANTARMQGYRAERRANDGLPLSNRNRKMPSLMTRLRRDVGITRTRRFYG